MVFEGRAPDRLLIEQPLALKERNYRLLQVCWTECLRMELFIKLKKTVGKQFGVKEDGKRGFYAKFEISIKQSEEMESRQQLYKSKVQVRSLGWRCKCGRQYIYTLNHEIRQDHQGFSLEA